MSISKRKATTSRSKRVTLDFFNALTTDGLTVVNTKGSVTEAIMLAKEVKVE